MTFLDVFRLASRAQLGARGRSVLTILAMAIGVAAVVVLTSLGEGARIYVTDQFMNLGTNLLIVLPGRAETAGGPPPLLGGTPRDLTIEDSLALKLSPAISRIAPVSVGEAPASRGAAQRDTIVLGTTADFFVVRHLEFAQGKALPPGDPLLGSAVCVIGKTIRKELFGSDRALGEWLRLGDRRFRVVGVLASGGTSVGVDFDEVVIVPVASAMALFNSPSVFRILVEAKAREEIDLAKRDILRIVRERHEGEDDITVISQDSVLGAFDRIFRALTLAVGGIAAISLAVAGILIMNVMLIAVSQRRAEIGLMKAIGATAGQVRSLFLTEAGILSFVGAVVGLGIGFSGTWVIEKIYPVLPLTAPVWAVAAAVGVAVGTGLLFGLLPASRAARLDPVIALSKR